MLVVGINGSPHKSGNTAYLLDKLLYETEAFGCQCKRINVCELFLDLDTPFCTNCTDLCVGSCYRGKKLDRVFRQMAESDAIIVASPVYCGTVTGQLKCFFDKTLNLRSEKKLIGKIGAAIAIGGAKYGGQEGTLRTIQNFFMIQGMSIISDSSKAYGAGHFGIGASEPANEDQEAISRIKVLADRIAEEISKF